LGHFTLWNLNSWATGDESLPREALWVPTAKPKTVAALLGSAFARL